MDKKKNIVIAWAENCAGSGWANTPVWYIERLPDGSLEQNCLQPEEQTKEMRQLFSYSALSAADMTSLVEKKFEERK